MPESTTHIIHRINLRVQVSSESEGRRWLEQSGLELQAQWLPLIEGLLDRYAVRHRHVRIDQLSVTVPFGKLGDDWMELAIPELSRQIESALQTNVQQETGADNSLSEQQHGLELFFYFLEHGVLPWCAPTGYALNSEDIIEALMRETQQNKRRLLTLLRSKELAVYRLIRQTDIGLQRKLARILLPDNVYKEWRNRGDIEQRVWIQLWTQLRTQDVSEILPNPVGLPPLPVAARTGDELNAPDSPSMDQAYTSEALVVPHAGLLLLHPFLPQLFSNLGWLQGDNFADATTQELAIHLLHYMAGGAAQEPEFRMVFEKFLCGCPPSFPIHRQVVLTDHVKEEAMSLLHSVIEHWRALKNTSVAGLQEGFLQRSGKLDPKGAEVIVERSGIDVLLDQLPWGIGTIKLPWLPQLLHVSWLS